MTWSTAIPVEYAGSRSAEGPLTIGQHNVLDWLGTEPDHRYASLEWTFELAPSTTVADIVAAATVLLSRHEGLRTEYLLDGEARQRVHSAGTLPVDVYRVDDASNRPEQIADALVARLKPSGRLDIAMRLAIAVSDSGGPVEGEIVHAAVALYSHLVVDFHAMAVLGHEFTAMLRNPALRRVGQPRHQPLDQATVEHSAEAQPRLAAALRYWEQQQTVMPSCAYPSPPVGGLTAPDPEPAGAATLSSAALALALPHIEARTHASRATIIMAAVCFVLGRRAGLPACRLPILSVNRFEPQLADFVGSLAQTTMLAVDLIDTGFDDLVRRTHSAMLRASRFGSYDIYRRVDITRQIVHQRGVKLGVEPIFNSLVQPLRPGRLRPGGPGSASGPQALQPNLEAIADALPRTWISWSSSTGATPVVFELLSADRVVRLRGITGDTNRITRAEVESLLRAVERLLVAAVPGDLPAEQIDQASGITPLQRGSGWLYTDHCWIELAAVCRLTTDALAPAAVRVEVRGDQIVARVTATPEVCHPYQAHERCLAALPGRATAMTPHHYVIHAATGDGAATLDHQRVDAAPGADIDWERLPVVAEGSGRFAPRHPR
jgi:hypothetical protein